MNPLQFCCVVSALIPPIVLPSDFSLAKGMKNEDRKIILELVQLIVEAKVAASESRCTEATLGEIAGVFPDPIQACPRPLSLFIVGKVPSASASLVRHALANAMWQIATN
ncbi:hypothetical protein VNO77_21303 [Canavalia gladiata]|uniref:Uncharacterized protein n=1 Tax=Canavalia gladiata TaxID=3824 RepID=A0AAN9QNA2_CANGL